MGVERNKRIETLVLWGEVAWKEKFLVWKMKKEPSSAPGMNARMTPEIKFLNCKAFLSAKSFVVSHM